MNKPIVSFCIATYQRYEVLNELIQEILSVESDEMEIVVCDNKSEDGSIEKIMEIKDRRLKVYINPMNVGSALNIHESLDKGSGEYLFYVNDRDNVDKFKISKLIEILKCLKKADVAFAKCVPVQNAIEPYQIFEGGKDALVMFACKLDHPTGYIFRRDRWREIKNRRYFFKNQKYGNYPITQVAAILAQSQKGALIFGDICDWNRHRIDFSVVKSGYYSDRADKRLYYSPEVLSEELKIGYYFLKKIGVSEEIRNQILLDRYKMYLSICVKEYRNLVSDPMHTAHYNFYPPQDFWHVFKTSMINGKKIWINTIGLVKNNQMRSSINEITRKEYVNYFQIVWDNFCCKVTKKQERNRKDIEIFKREEILKTYERWVNILLRKKAISEYLLTNNYCHVAIYGMGRIGKQLFQEFHGAGICVDYIIDKNLSKSYEKYENVRCYNLCSDLPYVDIIIVTVSSEAEEIIIELNKRVPWQAKSINDILFVIT